MCKTKQDIWLTFFFKGSAEKYYLLLISPFFHDSVSSSLLKFEESKVATSVSGVVSLTLWIDWTSPFLERYQHPPLVLSNGVKCLACQKTIHPEIKREKEVSLHPPSAVIELEVIVQALLYKCTSSRRCTI